VTCSAPTLQSGPVASLSGDGTSISTTSGNWDGHGCEISYDYEWQREAFFPVADANDAIYEVATDDDRGLGVSAIVRATNEGGTTAAFTNSVLIPQAPNPSCQPSVPANTALPSVAGDAFPGGWLAPIRVSGTPVLRLSPDTRSSGIEMASKFRAHRINPMNLQSQTSAQVSP